MKETEQYLQAGDIKLRAKDIKTLLEEHNNMKQEIERLKEEYMILQNASDEVEEEKDKEIERLKDLCNKYEKEHKTTYEIWKKDIYLYNSLVDRIDKAIEYIKVCKNNDMGIRYQRIEEILQGVDKE